MAVLDAKPELSPGSGIYANSNGNDTDHATERLSVMSALGVALLRVGDLDSAIGIQRQIITADPDASASYYNLGCTLYKKGLLDEALSAHGKSAKLDPHDPDPQYQVSSTK
jgi:tetratricopeptide (TPR) repeat protein